MVFKQPFIVLILPGHLLLWGSEGGDGQATYRVMCLQVQGSKFWLLVQVGPWGPLLAVGCGLGWAEKAGMPVAMHPGHTASTAGGRAERCRHLQQDLSVPASAPRFPSTELQAATRRSYTACPALRWLSLVSAQVWAPEGAPLATLLSSPVLPWLSSARLSPAWEADGYVWSSSSPL